MKKGFKVLLFLVAVIASMALICHLIPRDGIEMGKRKMVFPSLQDIIMMRDTAETAAEPELSPEELLRIQREEFLQSRSSGFHTFCDSSTSRFILPEGAGDDYFDAFFAALDGAAKKQVRILYFGDSQLEEDRMTRTLRNSVQHKFGGNGVGLVPFVQVAPTLSLKESVSGSALKSSIFGSKEFKVADGCYGIRGEVFRVNSPMRVSFRPSQANQQFPCDSFSRVTFLVSDTTLTIKTDGIEGIVNHYGKMNRVSFIFPAGTREASFSVNGVGDVYGIMFDGTKGVSVDNVAQRGCSGTYFTKVNEELTRDYLVTENVGMIILQFGCNAVPSINSDAQISAYSKVIFNQISYLKKLAPNAVMIFIGPQDMASNVHGVIRSYSRIPQLSDSLRHYSNLAGAAYWDMCAVMGGAGSSAKWVQSRWQSQDYIHFTQKGAEHMSDLFYESLMVYYDYYKLRTSPVDSLKIE